MTHAAPPELLTTNEAANRLRVHRNTLLRWEAAGFITAVRTPTGQRRYRAEEIDELMKASA